MKHYIGIDGGGTKTEMLVLHAHGEPLFTLTGGPCNPKSVTMKQAQLTIVGLLDEGYNKGMLEASDCLGICLGIAGIGSQLERASFLEFVRQYYKRRGAASPVIYVTNDAEIALAAGLGSNEGVIAIAGTGSIVYGISGSGQHFRVGGWGHLLGDQGSGYDIGLKTLQTVMLSYDGVEPPTQLTELVVGKLGLSSPPELRTWIYRPDIQKQQIADMAKLCIQAANSGDQAAISIMEKCAEQLARLTICLREKEDSLRFSPVVVTGSIFKYCKLYFDAYRERLERASGPLTIVQSQQRPVYGAAMLAASQQKYSKNNSGGG